MENDGGHDSDRKDRYREVRSESEARLVVPRMEGWGDRNLACLWSVLLWSIPAFLLSPLLLGGRGAVGEAGTRGVCLCVQARQGAGGKRELEGGSRVVKFLFRTLQTAVKMW